MGPLKLELRCPMKVHQIVAEPQPDWSFDSLLMELNSLDKKISSSSTLRCPYLDWCRGIPNGKTVERRQAAFAMRVSEEELEVSDDDDEEEGNDDDRGLVAAKRFNFDDFCARYALCTGFDSVNQGT
ncbi:hypothetical protein LINPERPRIM_LOCUS34725 [Linum perenne]